MKIKHPVSRVDSGRTHGWFARVYRGEWVGSRSFADSRYGGRDEAKVAAEKWVVVVDARLPGIPPKPVLKRAIKYVREDSGRSNLRYYDVYLPSAVDDSWTTQKFYFKDLDEQQTAQHRASDLVDMRNRELHAAYKDALITWHIESDRILDFIKIVFAVLKDIPVE